MVLIAQVREKRMWVNGSIFPQSNRKLGFGKGSIYIYGKGERGAGTVLPYDKYGLTIVECGLFHLATKIANNLLASNQGTNGFFSTTREGRNNLAGKDGLTLLHRERFLKWRNVIQWYYNWESNESPFNSPPPPPIYPSVETLQLPMPYMEH